VQAECSFSRWVVLQTRGAGVSHCGAAGMGRPWALVTSCSWQRGVLLASCSLHLLGRVALHVMHAVLKYTAPVAVQGGRSWTYPVRRLRTRTCLGLGA